MVISHISGLERCGLIVKDQAFGLSVASTSIGKLMARYYISFETIKVFRQLQGSESFLEVFNTIIRSREFSDFTLRVNDKKVLNAINNHPIRFPIKGKVKTNENKISCLIQAVFDNITIQDASMMQDALRMARIGEKISKCLVEYIRLAESFFLGKVYKAFSSALAISKCYRAKLWNNTQFVSKQLKSIGPVYSSLLVNAGKTTIQSLLETDARKIEMILGKAPPFGDQIVDALAIFPLYSMEFIRKTPHFLQVTIRQTNKKYFYNGQNASIIVGDADNNLLLYHGKVDQTICEEKTFSRTFPLKDDRTKFVQAKLIHECLVGVDQDEKIILNPDEELPEPKRRKPKVQTKIKLKTCKKASATDPPKQDLHKSLLDGDDFFKDINVVEIENRKNTSAATFKAEQTETCSAEPKKTDLKSFEYVPCSKIPKKCSETISPVFANYSKNESGTQPQGSKCYPREAEMETSTDDPYPDCKEIPFQDAADHNIIEALLDENFELEDDFIKSQLMKQSNENETSSFPLIENEYQPLDLRTARYNSESSMESTLPHAILPENDTPKSINYAKLLNQFNLSKATSSEKILDIKDQDHVIKSNISAKNDSNVLKTVDPGMKKPLGLSSPNLSLPKMFFSRQTSIQTLTKPEPNLPIYEFKKRPNLARLTNYSFRFTPVLRKTSKNSADFMKGGKSCFLPKSEKPPFSILEISPAIDHIQKNVEPVKKIDNGRTASKHSSVFSSIKRINSIPTKSSDEKIFSEICERLVPVNGTSYEQTKILNILEQEFIDKTTGSTNENEFFKEITSHLNTPASKINELKAHAEKIFKFRSLYQQPTFQKVLQIKTEQFPQAHQRRPLVNSTNPENDRIDKILQAVVSEPLQNLSSAISNPYRMKLPKRHKTMNIQQPPTKQNFEYFENMRRKTELEKLNSTFKVPYQRDVTYMEQMSKILFADLKNSKPNPVPASINTALLPKPDFELIENEKKRRQQQQAANVGNFFIFSPVSKNDKFVKANKNEFNETFLKSTRVNQDGLDFELNNAVTPLGTEFSKKSASVYDDSGSSKTSLRTNSNDIFHISPGFDSCAFEPVNRFIDEPSGFASPTSFTAPDSIDLGSLCNEPTIKDEPLSPSFEALSLMDEDDEDDVLLSQIKMEQSQQFTQTTVDLTTPFTANPGNYSQSKQSFSLNRAANKCANDNFFNNN